MTKVFQKIPEHNALFLNRGKGMSEKNQTPIGRRSFLGWVGKLGTLAVGAAALVPRPAMSSTQIVKAWEDPEYRNSLTERQWEQLPKNPAGEIENSEFSGDLLASGNGCSGNGCSGNGCSGNGCSGNGCSGNSCYKDDSWG